MTRTQRQFAKPLYLLAAAQFVVCLVIGSIHWHSHGHPHGHPHCATHGTCCHGEIDHPLAATTPDDHATPGCRAAGQTCTAAHRAAGQRPCPHGGHSPEHDDCPLCHFLAIPVVLAARWEIPVVVSRQPLALESLPAAPYLHPLRTSQPRAPPLA